MSIRDLIPPIFHPVLDKLRRHEYGWFGNYATWQDALKDSIGYDATSIVEKVKDGLLKVRDGKAAYERDSVLFHSEDYNWPVLTGLLWVAAKQGGRLNVVDFGGSLGSSFFQNRKFLAGINVQWNIVEQPIFVACGKKYFEDTQLRFHSHLSSCFQNNNIDVVLLSSVLPYLEQPYKVLQEILDENPPVIIFDKMPFLIGGNADIITVQRVSPSIYDGSYPAWFFEEGKFKDFLSTRYDIITEFDCNDTANIPSVFKGLIARRKQ